MVLRTPAALLLCAALSACATGDVSDYPTLSRRPVERQASVPSAPPTPAVPAPVSATLAEALVALAADANRGETAFRRSLGEYRAAIAAGRGAATGSEGWALAERARSRVDAARSPTTLALAELDRLSVSSDGAALDAVTTEQGRVATLVEAQNAVLASL